LVAPALELLLRLWQQCGEIAIRRIAPGFLYGFANS
jgi:hypothetical protein